MKSELEGKLTGSIFPIAPTDQKGLTASFPRPEISLEEEISTIIERHQEEVKDLLAQRKAIDRRISQLENDLRGDIARARMRRIGLHPANLDNNLSAKNDFSLLRVISFSKILKKPMSEDPFS